MRYHFSLISIGFGLTLSLLPVSIARAAIINYDFRVDLVPPNSSFPNPSLGFFGYDDSTLLGTGSESANLTNFDFNFGGTNYRLSDAAFPSKVYFLDGNLLGIDYSVTTLPQLNFTIGTNDASDAFFAYDTGSEQGAGDITFTRRNAPAGIPEPSAALALLSLGLMAIASKIYPAGD